MGQVLDMGFREIQYPGNITIKSVKAFENQLVAVMPLACPSKFTTTKA